MASQVLQGLSKALSGVNHGIWCGFVFPKVDLFGGLFASYQVNLILTTGIETKFFEWIGCSSFVKRYHTPLACIPLGIAVTNKMIFKERLDTIDKAHTLYFQIMQGAFFASLVYGLTTSLKNHNKWKGAYFIAQFSGAFFAQLHRSDHISTKNFISIAFLLNHLELLIELGSIGTYFDTGKGLTTRPFLIPCAKIMLLFLQILQLISATFLQLLTT